MMIGICGKSGCGKSTLAKQIIKLSDKKYVHLEIDKVGHHVLLVPEVQEELVKTFGQEALKEGMVDRKKLGEIVFDSRNEMDKLTEITWKQMQIEIDEFIRQHPNEIVILDWILLPISKYFDQCDMTILLDVPYEVRKQRAMKRDNISEEAFDLREKASLEYDPDKFDIVLTKTDPKTIQRLVKQL
jgi:dephospho-CoA kinase